MFAMRRSSLFMYVGVLRRKMENIAEVVRGVLDRIRETLARFLGSIVYIAWLGSWLSTNWGQYISLTSNPWTIHHIFVLLQGRYNLRYSAIVNTFDLVLMNVDPKLWNMVSAVDGRLIFVGYNLRRNSQGIPSFMLKNTLFEHAYYS